MNRFGNRPTTASNVRQTIVQPGISLIVLLFFSLAAVSLAMLSLSGARNDQLVSTRYQQQSDGLSAAYNAEQEWLATLSEDPSAMQKDGSVETRLFPISNTQSLSVTVTAAADGTITVTSEQVIRTQPVELDESLNVLGTDD